MTYGDRLATLIRKIKGRKGLRRFSNDIGSNSGTVSYWLTGDVQRLKTGTDLIAQHLGCSEADLSAYLVGEISLEDFLRGTNLDQAQENPLTVRRVITWFSTLSLEDLGMLAEALGRIIRSKTQQMTIGGLIRSELEARRWNQEKLAEEAQIPVTRLTEILANQSKPTNEEIIALAPLLHNPETGDYWDVEDLIQQVKRQYQVSHKYPNGVG